MIHELMLIPGVGKSITNDLESLGITSVKDLEGLDPYRLYAQHNERVGYIEDRCLLYVFRCAVYYAEGGRDAIKLKWWYWKG